MRKWITSTLLALSILLFGGAADAAAAVSEVRVPLHDGRLRAADMTAALCRQFNLPECKPSAGEFDLRGLAGSQFVEALNMSLGQGCNVNLADDGTALVLRVDTEKLPQDCEAANRAVRVFTATAAPEATAAHDEFYGVDLPPNFDPARPLVLLVHGLDSDRYNWRPMTDRLAAAGHQAATVTYPSDQPLNESAAFLAKHIAALRERYPATPLHVIAHSMGGLVVRAYVEGPDYTGGIDRFIMIATPNHGSSWARWRLVLEAQEHYKLWRHEPDWHWTWMVTDGLGEAGDDLMPGSAFLQQLNARPRRSDVRYTIVAGTQNQACRITADCVGATAKVIPGRVSHWWGLRHCKNGITRAAAKIRDRSSDGDGPVKVESARLEGVKDFVLVHADHATLFVSSGDKPPAAWEAVRERLGK